MKKEKKKFVYFWWSTSEIIGVEFIKYTTMRNGTGGEDTNKIGVGVIVKSELYPPYDGKEREFKVYPYMLIYKTYKSARARKNAIKRPTVSEVKEYEYLTKKLKHLKIN